MNPTLRAMTAQLQAAGCPDAAFDARELYRFVTGRDPRLEDAPRETELPRLQALADRRAAREPLQYLLGSWDFLDFTLQVGPGVLCPRADTEVVCEAAAALLQAPGAPQAPVVLDLCAGSGCLGLGLRRLVPAAQVTCVEKSERALTYLRANAAAALPGDAHAVQVVQADVFAFWQTLAPGSVDLIVSNPPYLTAAEMADLMPETAHEPAMALDGGADGLDFYRLLLHRYAAALRPGGAMVLEIGAAQAQELFALAAQYGWDAPECRQDYGGNDRVILLRKTASMG